MNQLSKAKRVHILQLLVEGNSIRGCSRIANVSINTVKKLLVDVGYDCVEFHGKVVKKIYSRRIQCDEMHSFVYSKEKNTPDGCEDRGTFWLWSGIDADTKMILSWYIGQRDQNSCNIFMNDLWRRLANKPQLTTDGYSAYREAVADTFGGRVHFGQLVKIYNGKLDDAGDERQGRYQGAERRIISGNPDMNHLHTSYIERQNLTMRTGNRRLMRRTTGFSKKLENHKLAIALQITYYNFCRVHQTLGITPAMATKVTNRVLSIEDLTNLPQKILEFSK